MVIVVLSILVVIAGIGYSNWVYQSALKGIESDLKTAASAMEQEKNFYNGYPGALPASYNSSNDTVITVQIIGGGKDFCLQATSPKVHNQTFHWRSSEQKMSDGPC